MIRQLLTVFCDNPACSRTREFNGFTRSEVNRELQKLGWVQIGHDTHICPNCGKLGEIVNNFFTETFGRVIIREKCNLSRREDI